MPNNREQEQDEILSHSPEQPESDTQTAGAGIEVEKKLESETAKGEVQPVIEGDQQSRRHRLIKMGKVLLPTIPGKDELTVKIEKIMEEGLGEAYAKLSPISQQEFKIKGEETAAKINELMKSARVKIRKVLKLILEWLKFLPGVNRYFLEQEAKIKTDKILALKDKQT